MKPVIYKYALKHARNVVALPLFAKVLCVQEQRGEICLWASVTPDGDIQERTFDVAVTGGHAPTGEYVGTVQLHGGDLVLHVFETTGA